MMYTLWGTLSYFIHMFCITSQLPWAPQFAGFWGVSLCVLNTVLWIHNTRTSMFCSLQIVCYFTAISHYSIITEESVWMHMFSWVEWHWFIDCRTKSSWLPTLTFNRTNVTKLSSEMYVNVFVNVCPFHLKVKMFSCSGHLNWTMLQLQQKSGIWKAVH